jgi:translocation and assembly module TamB
VFAEGTVGLGGQLGLDVLAQTGRVGLDPARLRLLGLRVPAVGPVPLTVLIEANRYLSNRLLHLRVTGTVRSPSVRVLPLLTLTQEAVRYFLNRYEIPQP